MRHLRQAGRRRCSGHGAERPDFRSHIINKQGQRRVIVLKMRTISEPIGLGPGLLVGWRGPPSIVESFPMA